MDGRLLSGIVNIFTICNVPVRALPVARGLKGKPLSAKSLTIALPIPFEPPVIAIAFDIITQEISLVVQVTINITSD